MKAMHVHVHGALDQVFTRARVQDDWAKWNAEHKHHTERAAHHLAEARKKGEKHPDVVSHRKAHSEHMMAASHYQQASEPGADPEHHVKRAKQVASRAAGWEALLKGESEEDAKKRISKSMAPYNMTKDDAGEQNYKRDQQGRFATSSGTGEQHAATAELHASLAARKGTDHPHHALHMAASEAHKQASTFLAQANKAQHPGAALEAERHAKTARMHENVINKGRGSDPKGEVSRQNKAMSSDPQTKKNNAEYMAELNEKYPAKGAKKKKTKDELIKSESKEAVGENIKTEMSAGKPQKQAIAIALSTQRKAAGDCGCGEDSAMDPIDQDTNLFDYGTQDDWAKWNAEHKGDKKKIYGSARADAGKKGQHALDHPSYESHAAAYEAHKLAAKLGSEVPYPGDNDYVSHHNERAATHSKEAGKHLREKDDKKNTKKFHATGDVLFSDCSDMTTDDWSEWNKMHAGRGKLPAPKIKPLPLREQVARAHKDLESHPNYHKDDHTYLKAKGYTPGQIRRKWDEERSDGKGPQAHAKAPDIVGMLNRKD